MAYPRPDKKVLLIYNHGSAEKHRWDQCRPNGSATPRVIKELSGKRVRGREIVVYGFCTPARIGFYRQKSRTGEPKVMRRAENIEEVVRRFQNSGAPPEQTFLAGNSAGAWAALLVARRQKAPLNAVIAFAPAFAGRKASRQSGWQTLRDDQVRFMAEAREMHALVYAFDSDPFNSPQDLAFLGPIPGVRLLQIGRP
jgi:predicted esterase